MGCGGAHKSELQEYNFMEIYFMGKIKLEIKKDKLLFIAVRCKYDKALSFVRIVCS